MAGRYEPITIYLTATGEIVGPSYKENGVVPALEPGQAAIDGGWDADEYWVSGGVATPRTVLIEDGALVELEVSVSPQTVIASLPAGTEVSADGFYGVTSSAEPLTVLAGRAGEFEIEIIPPFPALPSAFILVVSHAD